MFETTMKCVISEIAISNRVIYELCLMNLLNSAMMNNVISDIEIY